MKKVQLLVATILVLAVMSVHANMDENQSNIKIGAEQTEKYLPILKGKQIITCS